VATPLELSEAVDASAREVVEVRRDLHAHPELAWQESRTTEVIADRLVAAGIKVERLGGSGLFAEVGEPGSPLIGLRADLDALPVRDTTTDPWRSRTPGVAHACGHDAHAAGLLGAGLALHAVHTDSRTGPLPVRVRLIFQPAEEIMPGGANEVIEAGAIEDVQRIFAVHCDPSLDVGSVGLREGAVTGAADAMVVRLHGRGGHTSRPHLTEDLTYALGVLITGLPAALSRRLDPRAGASLVWGRVEAGGAPNVIPATGEVAGTLRMLDATIWHDAEHLVRSLIAEVVAPYGVSAQVTYTRGVPPVVNEPHSTGVLRDSVCAILGPTGVATTSQSLGGEDFAWYVEAVPGAMARLGTRTPGGATYDLHQGNLRIDERAVAVGSKVMACAALLAPESGYTRADDA
jgi:amidohydrolase